MRSLGFRLGQLGTVALLAVLTAITVKAQAPAKQPPPGQNGVGEITVRGCMQRGAERTTLTDATGTTYLLSHVSRSSRKSAFVEVHGEEFAPAGWHGEAALPGLRVTRMRRLSATCPQKIVPPPSRSNLSPPNAQSPSTPAYQSPIAPDGQEAAPVLNSQGAGGAPSPGTGNPPEQQPPVQETDKKK